MPSKVNKITIINFWIFQLFPCWCWINGDVPYARAIRLTEASAARELYSRSASQQPASWGRADSVVDTGRRRPWGCCRRPPTPARRRRALPSISTLFHWVYQLSSAVTNSVNNLILQLNILQINSCYHQYAGFWINKLFIAINQIKYLQLKNVEKCSAVSKYKSC